MYDPPIEHRPGHAGPDPRERTVVLDANAALVVVTLMNGLCRVRKTLPDTLRDTSVIDIAGWSVPATRPLTVSLVRLARELVGYVVGRGQTRAPPLKAALESIPPSREDDHELGRDPEVDSHAPHDLIILLRNLAVDRHNVHSTLEFREDGRTRLSWHPLMRETAMFLRLSRVLRHVEFFAQRTGLGRAELEAARWFFRSCGLPGSDPYAEQRQFLRECEFALVERQTILGGSQLDRFLDSESAQWLTTHEMKYARALQRRVAGIFEVIAADRARIRASDIRNGRIFELDEGDNPRFLRPGALMIGSLLPFSKRWRRVPGTMSATSQHGGRDDLSGLLDHIEKSNGVPLTCAIEFISSEINAPRAGRRPGARPFRPPCRDAGEARVVFGETISELIEAGILKPAPDSKLRFRPDGSLEDARRITIVEPEPTGDDPSEDEDDGLDKALAAWLSAVQYMIAVDEGHVPPRGHGPRP